MKLSNIKVNPNNPRVIKDGKFNKLVESLKEFPEMMKERPLVLVTDTDGKLMPLGGNMRLRALRELKYTEINDSWISIVDNWSDEQKRQFVIKDNLSCGEWDFDLLTAEYDKDELIEWGMDLYEFEDGEEIDYSDKNKELELPDFENEKYFFKLEYSETEYELLKNKISHIGKTPEQIFYEALI